MNSNSPAVRALAIVALLGAVGCATKPHQQPAMGQTKAASPLDTGSFDPKDPVATSAVREHAISLIEESVKSTDPQIRANAIEAASLSAERLKSIIVRGLDDTNPGVRAVAAMSCGKARLAKVNGRLRPLTQDQNAFVRAAAIYALARCGSEVDRSPLAGLLLHDQSLRVRSHAAFILGELGDDSAMPLLRQSIQERPAGVNPAQFKLFELQVAEAMVKLGDRGQCSVLQAALHPAHPDELETVCLAAQLIAEVQDSNAAAQLVRLADYQEIVDKADPKHPGVKKTRMFPPEVRLAAASALSALGIKGTGPVSIANENCIHPSAPIRAQAAYLYGRIGGTENWGTLDAMMGDTEGTVRVAAAGAVLRCLTTPPAN
jgi:HEAT repeat protein